MKKINENNTGKPTYIYIATTEQLRKQNMLRSDTLMMLIAGCLTFMDMRVLRKTNGTRYTHMKP